MIAVAILCVTAATLSAFGAATVTTNETGIVYDIACWTKSESYETTTARLAWPGKSLADIVAIKGTVNGSWIGCDYYVTGLIYDRTDEALKVQFQMSDSPGKVKAVRAELVWTPEGVTIRQTGAAIATQSLGTLIADSILDSSTTPKGASGYGVKGVEAYGDIHEIVEFPQPPSGGIAISNGTLRVKVSADVFSSAPISGNGRLAFVEGATPPSTLTSSATLPANGSWVTVLENTDLSAVTLTGSDFGGGWVEGTTTCTPYRPATQSDGSIIVQLQRLSWGASRCVRVQLKQVGADVQAKGIDSYGTPGDHLGEDATTWKDGTTGFSGGGYVISNLAFTRSDRYGVTLRGAKSWQGGTLVDGVRLVIRDSILPDRSTVKVSNGGILQLSAENVYNHYPRNTYDLAPGTQLSIDAFDAVNCGDTVIADAAAVKVISDHRAYLNDLTLKNGATLSGYTVRVGNTGAAVWRTSGELPISISTSIETVRYGTDPMTFNVGADIAFTGNIWEFGTRECMPLAKTGSGKLTLNGNVTSTASLTKNGGALSLNGNLKAAGLVLENDSTLEIAAGKTAQFGNSSGLTWTQDKILTLVGAFGESDQTLRVGTDANGLTRRQVKSLRWGKEKGTIDDQGWVHLASSGLFLFVR